MTKPYPNARFLAEPDWLAAHLNDADVRVIDARFDVVAQADGTFREVPGRTGYRQGHIPGAQFVDLHADLDDAQNPTSIAGPQAFEALMRRLGIGPRTTVVIYDDRGGVWAARLWWALRYYGHERVKMLNGGLRAWRAAGQTLQSEEITPARGSFKARPCPALRVEKDDVLAAIADPQIRIIDALPAYFYLGQASLYPHHRRGHIPGARNVPAEANLDPESLRLLPADALERLWRDAAIGPQTRVITYCGGGIYAAFALFVLALMGLENAALYDASWMEWGADENLPVETGDPEPETRKENRHGAR